MKVLGVLIGGMFLFWLTILCSAWISAGEIEDPSGVRSIKCQRICKRFNARVIPQRPNETQIGCACLMGVK
jgi:hypothetical protein